MAIGELKWFDLIQFLELYSKIVIVILIIIIILILILINQWPYRRVIGLFKKSYGWLQWKVVCRSGFTYWLHLLYGRGHGYGRAPARNRAVMHASCIYDCVACVPRSGMADSLAWSSLLISQPKVGTGSALSTAQTRWRVETSDWQSMRCPDLGCCFLISSFRISDIYTATGFTCPYNMC